MMLLSLDDPAALQKSDPEGMLSRVDRLADVAGPAFERGAAWTPVLARPRHIVVVGMGGSAISGDLARTLLAPVWDVPITVLRQPALPRWVGSDTLAIFLSYSGQTAETNQAFDQARAAGIPSAAVTVGGRLGSQASAAGIPVLGLEAGWQPRAALGELYFTLLGMLKALGAPVDVGPALAALKHKRSLYGAAAPDNLAKQIARTLHEVGPRHLPPAIFGVCPSTEAVALRWKCQLNENAKVTVLYGVFPELTHNEIVNLRAARRDVGPIVVLRDPQDDPLVRRQIGHALDILGGAAHDLVGDDAEALARQMSLVYLGDYVSVYLAFLRGIDPTPVEPIVRLKERMAADVGGAESGRATS